MGPCAKVTFIGNMKGNDNRYRHSSKCREGAQCTGPGCRIRTGKTAQKRKGEKR